MVLISLAENLVCLQAYRRSLLRTEIDVILFAEGSEVNADAAKRS